VPAAAVTPAPLAYAIVVAVKTLKVGLNRTLKLTALWVNRSAQGLAPTRLARHPRDAEHKL